MFPHFAAVQQSVPQQGAWIALVAGFTAYTFTLAAAAFTS
jgi:hypothetical protein